MFIVDESAARPNFDILNDVLKSRDWFPTFYKTTPIDLDYVRSLFLELQRHARLQRHASLANSSDSKPIPLIDGSTPISIVDPMIFAELYAEGFDNLMKTMHHSLYESVFGYSHSQTYLLTDILPAYPVDNLAFLPFIGEWLKQSKCELSPIAKVLVALGEHISKVSFVFDDDGLSRILVQDNYQAIHKDDQGNFHNEHGPALELRNGYKAYYIHGVNVPPLTVEAPEQLSVREIRREQNAEARRIMRERLGEENYARQLDLTVVDVDSKNVSQVDCGEDRAVPRMLVRSNGGERFLVGTDGSTGRVYYMPVPNSVRTCEAAHAFLCGFRETRIVSQS